MLRECFSSVKRNLINDFALLMENISYVNKIGWKAHV
jgi:hypothetical protein